MPPYVFRPTSWELTWFVVALILALALALAVRSCTEERQRRLQLDIQNYQLRKAIRDCPHPCHEELPPPPQ